VGPNSEPMPPDPFVIFRLNYRLSVLKELSKKNEGMIEFSGTQQLLVCVDGLNVIGENVSYIYM
jgi:hypothetical protein